MLGLVALWDELGSGSSLMKTLIGKPPSVGTTMMVPLPDAARDLRCVLWSSQSSEMILSKCRALGNLDVHGTVEALYCV